MNLLPLLQASPEALHLAGWCVYVCVWNSCSPVLHGEGQGGETQTNYSCGPGACGNCGLNNVGRESGARGRTREEEKRFTGKRSVYKLRQDEMAK